LINPTLANVMAKVRLSTAGDPRDTITVPLCPAPDVTDEVLFENAADATTKFYLPRYRLAVQRVNGQQQFRVSLEQSEQGGSLTVSLEKYPAPQIDLESRTAKELPHAVTVLMHCHVPGDAGRNLVEREFTEVQLVEEGLRVVLRVNSLAELTQLFAAMTDAAYGATLTVRRVVRVAIPVDLQPQIHQIESDIARLQQETDALQTQLATLQEEIGTTVNRPLLGKPHMVSIAVSAVANKRLSLRKPFSSDAEVLLPRAEAVEMADTMIGSPHLPRLRMLLVRIQKELAEKQRQVAEKQQQLTSLRNTPLFREVTRTLDHTVEHKPFVFPRDLHPYVTQSVTPVSGQHFGLIRQEVASHVYFQDQAQPHVFYYLPDSFKIARIPESPHYPFMSVRFQTTEGSLTEPTALPVTLEYVAVPFVDAERLATAASNLIRHVPEPLTGGVDGPVFRPFLADTLRYKVVLPRADVSEPTQGEYLVDLRSGIHHRLTLPVQDFQAVFEAMFGGSAVLFRGQVDVDLNEGANARIPPIPFIGRLHDLVGELFDYEESPEEASGGLKITLRNAIESPVNIVNLTIELWRGEARVLGQMQGLDLTSPVELSPGAAIGFVVVPTSPLPGEGPLTAVFNLQEVEVRPDPQALWNAILDPTVPAEYTKTIVVRTFPEIFTEHQIEVIEVDFERGNTVELTAAAPNAEATLRFPISDIILRQASEGTYSYRLTVVRKTGQVRDSAWRTDNGTIFITAAEIAEVG
jgi:hypothetical protein